VGQAGHAQAPGVQERAAVRGASEGWPWKSACRRGQARDGAALCADAESVERGVLRRAGRVQLVGGAH
jgi:hypothetical protein